MTTQSFVRPGERVPDPETGGGKIKLEAPIVAPIPIPRSIWGIVLPIGLLVGIVGLIVVMYASGQRQLAGGFGLFGGMAGISAIGLLVRNRGAGRKMSFGELLGRRRKWFSRLDEIRDEVDVQRQRQWAHRRHFHWDPTDLFGVAGSERMWDREPGEPMFAVVRVGVGKVKLAMTLEKPEIAPAADLEPATGHALRKFLNAQEYVDDMPKVIWLQRFPGLSFVGDLDEARSLARAVMCQLAAFHSPADLQLIVVSSDVEQWDWVKWLPHVQHDSRRDGCGERRMVFSSPAELEAFFDEQVDDARPAWSPPSSGVTAGLASAMPLRVIIDDHCGSPEDWAGLTGASGYASTCFVRLATDVPPRPSVAAPGGARFWVGFTPDTTYRLRDGVLRKQVSTDPRQRVAQSLYEGAAASDELDDAFYATADAMSVDDAERFARSLARYRAPGSASVTISASSAEERTLLDVLGIRDPRRLDTDRLWAATRAQGPAWMRFPVGVYSDTGEVAEFNLREGSQGGMGMHSLFIGTTGAGKSEGLITAVAGACLTHSPEVLNIVFTDFKLKSAAGMIGRFPHVVAAVSNLAEERHLVGRLYDALDGEIDRRGKIIADLEDCPDITTYNQRRLVDPSLPPIPALWVITDEYNEVFADPIWGPKFRKLYLRIARVGRSLHVFLQLVGQTKDTQNLRDINKLLGFSIAARTGTEEESRAAIGSNAAAHIASEGEEGTAYLRVALREPRKFRYFYTSADFVPKTDDAGVLAAPQRSGAEFAPRVFTAAEARDVDNRLTAPPAPEVIPLPVRPVEAPFKLATAITDSLQAAKERPPRSLWLPVLGDPTPADELVARWRGRPWYEDYGNNPGLVLPVALADYPRGARQEVYSLDMLNDNALVVAAPGRGATTAVMTMVTTGALLYRPERVQFYCIAASGPQLARVADLPHVASVVAVSDAEGVSRMVSTLENIVLERDKAFTTRNLDMGKVRAAKFGPNPVDIGVSGGEVVLVVDGWKNFTEGHTALVDRVLALQRARNYGVRVIITHTSSLSGLQSAVRAETGQRLELKLVNEHDTEVKRDPRDPERNPVREVPDLPGRGLTRDGHHLMVGAPVLATPPQLEGRPVAGPVEGDALSEIVRRVSGVDKATTVVRLPESVPLADVFAGALDLQPGMVPFGLAESTLGTATIDFHDHPHVVATGLAGSGLTAWLRAMMKGIMASYRSQDATIILIDPRRTSVGVVPEDTWLGAYAQTPTAITAVVDELCAILEKRRPPPGTSQHDLATKRFWEGREFFVVIDGITSWSHANSPLAKLIAYVDEGDDLGLHIVATADIRTFSYQSQGGVLGRMMNMQAPVVIMDGHRSYGAIVPGVFAAPQRPGKGLLWTRRGTDGVLVGWSDPPVIARRR
ncbi:S-DNA-T family DNA segregation ATPase FtsK/SpoIIIE [Mycobacterium sp. OAS707]|uniref:type VII secretion protein EccCa n=1 Tax=Mycobacterium sp. OAS707 TaxID=2663822 RepID=UPI00178944FF|nr:S-DNA-T family DNA segregation ATPase FtsK/SpoIIIE [Mycobacterium sp. OAS707]